MKLIIAEKNSVAVEIGKAIGATNKKKLNSASKNYDYLEGSSYIISWCVGHLIRLYDPDEYDPRYKSWEIDLLPIFPATFKTKVARETFERYQVLKSLMDREDVTELICATDAGREGELIFRLVYQHAKCTKPFQRLWISSVAPESIRTGMQHLTDGHAYDNLYAAALCRQRADWLLGMNLTRLYTKAYGTKLRIGRVKTPTVGLIVQRDKDIKSFVKQPYYSLVADFGSFLAHTQIVDSAEAQAAVSAGNKVGTGTVVSLTQKENIENSPCLYDLTTLQRDANKLLGYTAKQTAEVAQRLYEKKMTTYPRTDSSFLTAAAADGVKQMLPFLYREFSDILPGDCSSCAANIAILINEEKVSDHHAIIPDFNYIGHVSVQDIECLPTSERSIFFLILFRLIAALSPPHRYCSTVVHFDIAGIDYKATGVEEKDAGFTSVQQCLYTLLPIVRDSNTSDNSAKLLPRLEEGKQYPVQITAIKKFTRPPSPYTEDSLLKAMSMAGRDTDDPSLREVMKDKGLGTPATRADIIEEMKKNGYVETVGRQLRPTELAYTMISVVAELLINPETTSKWEYQLSLIQQGKITQDDFLGDVIWQIDHIISTVKSNAPSGSSRPSIGTCPKCGKKVLDTPRAFSCAGGRHGCGFVIWKQIAGKSISSTHATQLLTNGHTDLLRGFRSKAGKPFNAHLVLQNDGSIKFVF